jgi:ferredoxin-NADP reductase/ferredoxin
MVHVRHTGHGWCAMSVRVTIRSGCNGMGSCVRLSPRVFRIDPATGKAEVLLDDCTPHREAVMQAARSCPFVAVEVDGVPIQERIDPATVHSCERLTPDIVELRLKRPGYTFTPGQYVFLRLTDAQGEFFRTYSAVESNNGILSLCIRLVTNGRAGQTLASMTPGTEVGISQPKGLFTLRSTDQPKLFVTGGTGLAPVIPMCLAAPEARKRVVIGARTEKDLFWVDRLRAIPNTEVITVVQNPGPGWQGATGLVTSPLEDLDPDQWPEVYTCGSPGMVEAVRRLLTARGMPAERIYADSFVPAGTTPAIATGPDAGPDKPRRDWPGLLRRWHYIASAPLAFIILFYAITGFIANRSDLFVGEDTANSKRLLPEGAGLERDRLTPVLAAMLPDDAQLVSFADGPPITAVFNHGEGRSWSITVDPSSRAIRLSEQGHLPPDLALTPAAVGAYLATRLSGSADLDHATVEDGSIELEMASVWGTHRVEVDTAKRFWTSSSVRPPLVVSLTDLHRGKHAGRWQRILIDVTALVLALVTISGAGMSLLATSPQRRRQACLLLGTSAVLVTLLLISR